MVKIRKLVLDVIKPQEPNMVEVARAIAKLKGVDGVNVSLLEIDRKVENVRITIQGSDLNVEAIFDVIESLGGAVHSIDEVAAGKEIIEHAVTLEES